MTCTHDCEQGKFCVCGASDMPIVFVEGAFEWLKDIVYTGVSLSGALILGAVGVCGLAYGLRAVGLL